MLLLGLSRRYRNALVLLPSALTSLVSGCAHHRLAPGQESLRRHAIFVGRTGDGVDALTEAQARREGRATDAPLDSVRFNIYVDSLIAAVEASGKDTILLFVHGGRVGLQSGANHSFGLTPAITASNYYPVFVLWDASQNPSLGWHLFRYRYGKDYGPVLGPVTAPFVIGGNLASAAYRLPWTFLHQTADYCRTGTRLLRDTGKPSDASCYLTPNDWKERTKLQGIEDTTQAEVVEQNLLSDEVPLTPRDPMHVSWRRYRLSRTEYVARGVSNVVLSPIKLISGSLIDGFGTGTWDEMVRRTDAMFRPERELLARGGFGAPRGRAPSGATGVLLNKLSLMLRTDSLRQDSLVGDPAQRRYKRIILAGHSMGAIVVNRILREYPDLPVARVQYLAAAASVADVESSVIPMLRRRPDATFEHATLHPYAEAGERQHWLVDLLVPRASLLEWIDNHFEKARAPSDRRAGKWRNIALGLHVFPNSVRSRVTIKAFGVGDTLDRGTRFAKGPAKHGDFDAVGLRFWCRDYWAPGYAATGSPQKRVDLVRGIARKADAEQAGCPPETPTTVVRPAPK